MKFDMKKFDVNIVDGAMGIKARLDTLDGLHELIHLRMEYAKRQQNGDFQEALHGWVVLNGLLLLFDDGRIATSFIDRQPIMEAVKGIPTVMEFKTFRELFPEVKFSMVSPHQIPMGDCKCPICNEGWETWTCRQVQIKSLSEHIVFNKYAGRTLDDVLEEMKRETGKHFFMQSLVDAQYNRVEPRYSAPLKPGMRGDFKTIRFMHSHCCI
jgi:hypothetical protein